MVRLYKGNILSKVHSLLDGNLSNSLITRKENPTSSLRRLLEIPLLTVSKVHTSKVGSKVQ